MRERDDRGALVDPVEDLVGPRLDDLVGARQPLRRRERGARVDDCRAPAELLPVRGEMLGGLGGAEDQHSQWALDHLGEDAVVAKACLLEQTALEPLLAGLDIRVEHRVLVVVEHAAHLAPQLGLGLLEPDVDLAAAGEADLERVAVGDAVVNEVGGPTREDLLCTLGDVGLDATARHGADVAAALGDDVLRAGLARRRPDRADDGGDCRLLAAFGGGVDRVEDRTLHRSTQVTPAASATGGVMKRVS